MERRTGEELEVKLRIKAVKSHRPCVECIFHNSAACEELNGLGNCDADARTDGKHIHFEIVSPYSL